MNWKGFLEQVKKEPKNFAKAIVDNLNPPKYVLEELKRFEWMCHFCWKPSVDVCSLCQRRICEEHIAKKVVGEKTKLEWYFCLDCIKTHSEGEIMKKVKTEDEEFWLEDQETT